MRLLAGLLLGACLCLVQLTQATEYGVGFGLAIGYGVASVHFRNGSTVNIAKIEGSLAYQATMKMAPHIHTRFATSYTDHVNLVDRQKCDCYHAVKPPGTKPPSVTERCFRLLQESLPPWMGGPEIEPPAAGTKALVDMIGVLKLTAETYLDAEVTNASVSVPFPVGTLGVSRETFEVRLREAGSALNINLFRPEQMLELVGLQDRDWHRRKRSPYTFFSCHPDEELLALGVDFSDEALTATIQVYDCGDFWTARVLHSIKLGAHELFEASDWRRRLVDALHDVTALPVQGTGYHRTEDIDHIGRLILMGDRARDPKLHEALRDVFGEQYETLIGTMRDDGTSARDPLFLGATCGARWNWRRNHYYHPFDDYGCTPPGPHSYYRQRLREKLEDVRHVVHQWFRSSEDKKAELLAMQKQERLAEERARYPFMLGPP